MRLYDTLFQKRQIMRKSFNIDNYPRCTINGTDVRSNDPLNPDQFRSQDILKKSNAIAEFKSMALKFTAKFIEYYSERYDYDFKGTSTCTTSLIGQHSFCSKTKGKWFDLGTPSTKAGKNYWQAGIVKLPDGKMLRSDRAAALDIFSGINYTPGECAYNAAYLANNDKMALLTLVMTFEDSVAAYMAKQGFKKKKRTEH